MSARGQTSTDDADMDFKSAPVGCSGVVPGDVCRVGEEDKGLQSNDADYGDAGLRVSDARPDKTLPKHSQDTEGEHEHDHQLLLHLHVESPEVLQRQG